MAQSSIPVQRGETAATAALRVVAGLAGGVVLFTTNGTHSTGSFHYKGRAVDVALPSGPTYNSPELGEVAQRILKLIPIHFISEFIWAGPNPMFIKHGERVGPYAASTHRNHIHVAVVPTFRFNAPKENAVPDLPDGIHPAYSPVVNLVVTPSGNGYWIICEDGSLYAFGDAKHLGSVAVQK